MLIRVGGERRGFDGQIMLTNALSSLITHSLADTTPPPSSLTFRYSPPTISSFRLFACVLFVTWQKNIIVSLTRPTFSRLKRNAASPGARSPALLV